MKIHEVIETVAEEMPNDASPELVRRWLSDCEAWVYDRVTSRYEGAPEAAPVYDAGTDGDTELTVGSPYDELYVLYVERNIAWRRMETDVYNTVSVRLSEALERYAKHVNETREHKQPCVRWY